FRPMRYGSGLFRCFISLLVLCSAGLMAAQSPVIVLSSEQPDISVYEAEFIPDPDNSLTPEILLQRDTGFQTFSPANPGFSPEIQNYWIRFSVQNPDSLDHQWVFAFNGWSYVNLHTLGDKGILQTQRTGHLLPVPM